MIFVDANIAMYLVGAPHPNRSAAQRLLERAIRDGTRLVSNGGVLQEILHRYVAIGRRDAIQPAFDALLGLVDEVFPVELADAQAAKSVVLGSPHLSARDALHVAVMRRRGIGRILSFDAGFDGLPGVVRVS